jgi:photosystem II stability/assembly factor-like uncharacterized protein
MTKLSRLLPVFFLILTACASPVQTQPESAPPADTFSEADAEAVVSTDTPSPEAAPPTKTSEPTDTPAPFAEDTPVPPTIAAPIVSSPEITFLRMFNELDGWAISQNAVLRTPDGGSTWYNVSPQGATEFGYGTANTFLNASQAWVMVTDASDPAGSGLLYRTEDGGLTWTVYPVPFGGGILTFTNEEDGWMMSFLGIAAGSMGIAIYQTEDGGATWSQAYTNDPNLENAGDSLPLSGIKNNLTPLDADTAWVGGVVYAPETFYLYKTIDSGQSWAPQTLPSAPGVENSDFSIDSGPIFTSSSDAILPIRFAGETDRTGFYVTQDSGENWEFASFMPGSGEVDFVSPTEGFFWTGEQFFVTADGAQTWTSVNVDVPFSGSFAGMDFVNTRTGWVWTYDVTGEYGLYKTTDGGGTWFSMED